MLKILGSTDGIQSEHLATLRSARVEWDEESVAEHEVEVRVVSLDLRTYDDSPDLFASLMAEVSNRSRGSDRRFLAASIEVRDSSGLVLAETKTALSQPFGGNARDYTYLHAHLYLDAETIGQIATFHGTIFPGGPHPERRPTPIPIQVNDQQVSDAGMRITHKQARCRGTEFPTFHETTIVHVAFRLRAESSAKRDVRITAVDDNGIPIHDHMNEYRISDEDPAHPGVYVFGHELALPTVPDRIIINPAGNDTPIKTFGPHGRPTSEILEI